MTINAEALQYIKDSFDNESQLNDYIELLDIVYSYGVTFPGGRNVVYDFFIGGNFNPNSYISSGNYWYDKTPPTVKGFIVPDNADQTWVDLRKKALSAAITGLGGLNVGLVDDATGIEFLKARFDKSISSNITLDDKQLEDKKVWEKFYKNDLDGTDRSPRCR